MAQDKIYPRGLICFPKNDKQPDFVLGSMVITPNALFTWLKENESLLSEYKGEKQLRLQILNGNKGLYVTVDTFKPTPKAETQQKVSPNEPDGLPF